MIFWLFARFKKQQKQNNKHPLSLDTFTIPAAQMTFLLLAAVALANGVIGAEHRIKNVDEFIEFKDNVNKGIRHSGATVFLDSDLSLAGKSFEPIGNSSSYFYGTFDGQGHVISNLAMTSSFKYVGLFGCLDELTIKNVILDSSCSIKSTFSSSSFSATIGGIIGYCRANHGPCIIENCVNMGSVTFIGNISSCISGELLDILTLPFRIPL